MASEPIKLGTKRVCVNCGRIIVATKDPRVVSLTAGVWLHTSSLGKLLCRGGADPGND